MSSTISSSEIQNNWDGGSKPLDASYGKLMMWFFIVSDALTFTGFLVAYGFSRFKNIDSWPIADEVFYHFPFLHGVDAPMYYVALMTFILIFSSVTMVLAVDAGHHNKKNKVVSLINFTGIIAPNMGRKKGLNIQDYNKLIEQAFQNKRNKAVVLVINSPGGSPVQSEFLADRIINLSKEKNIPVITVCSICS